MDNRLLKILEEEVAKEKDRKKARVKGIVTNKKISKNNNIILIVNKTDYEEAVLINKNKENLFKIAENTGIGDLIYFEGERKVNIIFGDKLEIVSKKEKTLKDF